MNLNDFNQQEIPQLNKAIKRESSIIEVISARNPANTNNCFVNVIMQVLFHAKQFRESVINYKQEQSELMKSIKVNLAISNMNRSYLLNIKNY